MSKLGPELTVTVTSSENASRYFSKVLGYKAEYALFGDIASILHYNGGARLTEYMNIVRRRRLNTR